MGDTGAGWGMAPSPERGYGLRSPLLRTPPSSPRLGPALGWPGSPRGWGRQSVKEAGPGEAATCALKAASQRGTARAGGGGRNRGACEEGGGSPAFPPLPSRPVRIEAPLPSLQRRLSAGPGLLRVPPAGEVRGGSGSTGSAAEDGDYRGSAGMRAGPLPQGPPAPLRLSSVPTSERSSGCSGGTPRRGGGGRDLAEPPPPAENRPFSSARAALETAFPFHLLVWTDGAGALPAAAAGGCGCSWGCPAVHSWLCPFAVSPGGTRNKDLCLEEHTLSLCRLGPLGEACASQVCFWKASPPGVAIF